MLRSIGYVSNVGQGLAPIRFLFHSLTSQTFGFKAQLEVVLEAPGSDEEVQKVVFKLLWRFDSNCFEVGCEVSALSLVGGLVATACGVPHFSGGSMYSASDCVEVSRSHVFAA